MTRDEIDTIIADQPNKSAKARVLKQAGVSVTEIGTILSISYQHTYNILKRAGLLDRQTAPAEIPPSGNRQAVALELSEDGMLVLTPELIAACNLQRGSLVIARQTSGGLLLMSREAALAATLEAARAHMPEEALLIDALLKPTPELRRNKSA